MAIPSNLHFDVVCHRCGHIIVVPSKMSAAKTIGLPCPACGDILGKNQRLTVAYKPADEPPPQAPRPGETPQEQQQRETKEALQALKQRRNGGGPPSSRMTLSQAAQQLQREMQQANGTAPKPLETDQAFRSRLLSVMTDNKFDRKIPKRRKGKLDGHNIWRAKTGVENIFRQKQERKNKDYHVVLLVDQSGSMRDYQKNEHAAELALFMAKELGKVDIKFSIVGFSDDVKVYKDANKPKDKFAPDATKKKLRDSLGGGGTNIHYGLETAFDLVRHEEHGKIVIVFSDGDGDPSGIHMGDVAKFQKKFGYAPQDYDDVQQKMPEALGRDRPDKLRAFIEAHHEITTIGVGVLDEGVKQSFPNHIVVKDMKKFKLLVLQALKKAIKRG